LTQRAQVPPGRLKRRLNIFQPSLRDSIFFQSFPALKCRAIFDCSFGTMRRLKIKIGRKRKPIFKKQTLTVSENLV
jgi:hypothetical protein